MSTALERTDQCIKTLHNTIVHHWHFDKPGDWKCIKTLHNTIVHQEALARGVF